MKKKIIALIMVIPIILMFTVFNVAKTYSLIVDISVSGVKLDYVASPTVDIDAENEIIYIDMADATQTLRLTSSVLPTNAKNQKVNYSVSAVEGKDKADVTIDVDGKVTPYSSGTTRLITTTADGGFSDSVILVVSATKPSVISLSSSHTITDGKMVVYASERGFTLSLDTDASTDVDNSYTFYANWQYKATSEWKDISSCKIVGIEVGSNSGSFAIKNKGSVTLRAVLDGGHTASGKDIISDEVTVTILDNPDIAFELPDNIVEDTSGNKELVVYKNESSHSIYINPTKWEEWKKGGKVSLSSLSTANNDTILAEDIVSTIGATLNYDTSIATVTLEYNADTSMLIVNIKFIGNTATRINLKMEIFDKPIEVKVRVETEHRVPEDFVWQTSSGKEISKKDGKYTLYSSSKSKSVVCKVSSNIKDVKIYGFKYESADSSMVVVGTVIDNSVIFNILGKVGSVCVNATLTLHDANDEVYTVQVVLEINIIRPTANLSFKESNSAFGIKSELTIGEYRYDSNYGLSPYSYPMGIVSDASSADIEWKSSDTNIATVTEGNVTVVSNGSVKVTATSRNSVLLNDKKSAEYTLTCVKDAVNVMTYAQLIKATDSAKAIVLRNSIGDGSLERVGNETLWVPNGEQFYLYGAERNKLKLTNSCQWYAYDQKDKDKAENDKKYVAYTTQSATSDTQFQRNKKTTDIPDEQLNNTKINIGVKITKNVYGNGYIINADNLARTQIDSANKPVFRDAPFHGPVAFVFALGYTVFGQDNVAFFIKGDGITVSNITLQSINDGMDDLTTLDFAGTTVEVDGGTATNPNIIEYSRLKLGRTVLRVFSGNANSSANDNTTTLTVNNCILGQSREFTIRMGANKVVKASSGGGSIISSPNYGPLIGSYINPTRYYEVNKKDGTKYKSTQEYNDALLSDSAYLDSCIRTKVTLRDSVLEKSGMFSIAMDSHFAGQLLNLKGNYGWSDLAGTSYGALLRLEGQVRVYDWKDITTINSNSLVGLSSNDTKDPFGMTDMIRAQGAEKNLIYIRPSGDRQQEFVHGCIAFFGGGRNYSLIDNQTSNNTYHFPTNTFDVAITSDITIEGKSLLYAAGDDAFRFYMNRYDDKLSYEQQLLDFNGSAYEWLKK